MAQKYLSKTRTWEYALKSGVWGVTDETIGELPEHLRQQLWTEVIRPGQGFTHCGQPSEDLLNAIELHFTFQHPEN